MRFPASLSSCVAALTLLVAAQPASAEEAAASKQVVLFGSSSMNDSLGHLLAADLTKAGAKVTRKGVPAAGFSRPDYRDVFQIVETTKLGPETDLAILYFGMNDAQAFHLRADERDGAKSRIQWDDEARWVDAYRTRAHAFFEQVCDKGVKKVAVLLPVDVKSPVMQKRLDRIRLAQREAAQQAKCAVVIDTSGDTGNWGKGADSVRVEDGVHMTSKGAKVLWQRIKGNILPLVNKSS